MRYSYAYDAIALAEFHDAIAWYGAKSIVAAENFIVAVEDKIGKICTHPAMYRNSYKKYRETSLDKFPYSIVYFVDDNAKRIIVTSVYHHKRSNKRKYKN